MNESTSSSNVFLLTDGIDVSSSTEKSISESFNETIHKVIKTKDMVSYFIFKLWLF
jgi:hypothetical protein